MEALSEFFPQIVLHVFAPLLCVCLAAWAALCLCRFLSSIFCTLGRRVPPAQWVAIAAVMVVCTLFSGKNTNSVQSAGFGAMGIPPVAMLMHGSSGSTGGTPVEPAVTPEDMSKGWLDFTTATQTFAIDAAGTVRVEKFNCSVERDIQGHTNATVNLPEGR